jgi:hypothetical protein
VVGIALAGAVFLGLAHLKMHGHYHCVPFPRHRGLCVPASSYWVVGRAVWQIPAAIVGGLVGFGVAFVLLRR